MEPSMTVETAKQLLLSVGIILATGVFSGFLSHKIKVPDVVIFLVAGIVLGPEMTGILHIAAESLVNQIILIFGACYILFDGGASIRLQILKEVWITLTVIATVGVLIMTVITGVVAHYVLAIPLITALLLGATIASTDPATIVPIFRQVKIRDRVSQTVMSESAFNDATGAIITFAVLAVSMGTGDISVMSSLLDILKQSSVGILMGVLLGYLAAFFIAHEKYDFLAEYAPIVTLMAVIGAYLGADGLQASGFMAVFVFGIMLGNKETFGFKMRKGENKKLEEYISTTSLLMRMFIFILLGSQVDFSLMGQCLASGIIVVLVFMLVARPVTVFCCAYPDRRAKWSMNEIVFMCWTRETGVIPAALAGLLLGRKVPGAPIIAAVTFIAILMTILIQATTTKWLARKLGLLEE
jgi:potassium/hydrogen antiporter